MSLEAAMNRIPPPLVAAAGVAVLAGMPWANLLVTSQTAAAGGAAAQLALLQGANLGAFALNCLAVSVPGRIDGEPDDSMRHGNMNPNMTTSTPPGANTSPTTTAASTSPLLDNKGHGDDGKDHAAEYTRIYSPSRGRTLVAPAGWAFAIWAPIYIGEGLFVAAQLLGLPPSAPSSELGTLLPDITAPFVAANLLQSLWCVAFRPHYTAAQGNSYISAALLAGTAFSLSKIHFIASAATGPAWWYLLPMSVHFGWTSAATLVNLSGSVAMDPANSERAVTAVGHFSAVAATALGIGLTVSRTSPVYGCTIAWALAACADGMRRRIAATKTNASSTSSTEPAADVRANFLNWQGAASVQEKMCWMGSVACLAAAASTFM